MQKKTTSAVAEFLTEKIKLSAKLQSDISREAGFQNPNVITMIKQGQTKLPLARIPLLATALGINPGDLLALAMKEYMPEVLATIEDCLNHLILTPDEQELVLSYRQMRI